MKRLTGLIVTFGLALCCMAASPYELHLRSGKQTHVGLVAAIKDSGTFAAVVKELGGDKARSNLEPAGITDLQVFARKIEGKDYAVVYFAYPGGTDYLGAAEAFEKATAKSDWKGSVTPHPRAVRYGRTWLQMEWISFIRGLDVDRAATSTVMLGTTLLPEKELEYRTLHQTVWPGVVDQIARGNNRNLCIFLVELEDLLVKFLYVEYMGDDEKRDAAANLADPVNQRWWKLTDACQKPFADFKGGIWAPLKVVE